MTRQHEPTALGVHEELELLRARLADSEARIARLTFERDGYYGEWRHAKNQLDAVRRSPVWPLWLLWRLVRAILSLPLAAIGAVPSLLFVSCHSPVAPFGETARGWNPLSSAGRNCSSRGMPRSASSAVITAR